MTASVYDSAIFGRLFAAREAQALFTDRAELRAMLVVLGALAKAQGTAGLIPETAAEAIRRASLEVEIDPAALADATAVNAVPVPALVPAFRAAMGAPDHAQWVHFGATSQDIVDTALVLRLRRWLEIVEAEIDALLEALAGLARAHAGLPMAARTYGQAAVPTSFGAVVAGWGWPILGLAGDMAALRAHVLAVSLGGAAGTLSAMGDRGPEVRAGLAEGLGLADPGRSWHSDRTGIATLSGWAARGAGALAKMGADLTLASQSGIEEVRLPGAGASSTMPQKRNPVLPELMVAIGTHVGALDAAMQGAVRHRQQRDAAAWITEWMCLPQICLGLARSLGAATVLAREIEPDGPAMREGLRRGGGLIFAEALSFRLASEMSRPDAQAAVKALAGRVAAEGRSLADLAAEAWPHLDLAPVFDPAAQLGTAPDEARAFAGAVARRLSAVGS